MKKRVAAFLSLVAILVSAVSAWGQGSPVVVTHELTGYSKGDKTVTLDYVVQVQNQQSVAIGPLSLSLIPRPPFTTTKTTLTVDRIGPRETAKLDLKLVTPLLLDQKFFSKRPLAWAGKYTAANGKVVGFPARSKPAGVQAVQGNLLNQAAAVAVPDAGGVAVDQADNVYVTTTDSVEVFSSAGVLIGKWGGYGSGDGQFSNPNGIAVDNNGKVYVADTGNNRVQVFNTSGGFLYKWADAGPPVSIASDGSKVYVLGGGAIRLYDSNGTFLSEFGRHDEVYKVADRLDLASDGLLYVTYYGDGALVKTFSNTNLLNSYLIGAYWAATADGPDGNIYVATYADPGGFLTVYDRNMQPLRGLLGSQEGGWVDDIELDSKGNIYVCAGSLLVFGNSGDATYSVSGTVRQDSASGPVVPGATVSIGGRATTTSSTGTFSISWLPAGTYAVTISKAGYATKSVTGYVVSGDQSGADFYLDSSSSFSMSGTVRQGSATGPLLAGATVAIAGKTAMTSSTGAFSITGIPAGTHTLTISRTGYVTKTISDYVVNSDSSGLTFYLTRVTYSLSGTVRKGSVSGTVLSGVTVSIAGRRATTASDGTFTVTGIPSGSYTLYLSKTGYVSKSITGYAVNSDRSGVVFYLTPATHTISGTVRQGSSTGPVLSGATVSIGGKSTTTGSTGTFSIAGIPTGTYAVTISKPGFVTKTVTGLLIDRNRSGLLYFLIKK